MPPRLTTEAIHLLRKLMEWYRDRTKGSLSDMFIDLEKKYDRVPCEMPWRYLEQKRVQVAYIQVIWNIDEGLKESDWTFGGDRNELSVDIGLHQGSALSHFLFICEMINSLHGSKKRNSVCYLQMIFFLSISLWTELTLRWSDGDISQSPEVLK